MSRSKHKAEPSWKVRVAYHEAGHAVMAWLMEQRTLTATIVPDDDCEGHVLVEPDNCETIGDWYRDKLMFVIAGDAAEQVFIDPPHEEYAEVDLWNAVRILEAIDSLSGGSRAGSGWKGLDHEYPPDFQTEQYDALIDKHTAAFDTAFEEAMDILYEERLAIEAVADALLKNETLSGKEIISMIDEVVWSQKS